MATRSAYPTEFPAVNDLIAAQLSGLGATLAGHLVGIYLHGSLALGDFDPQRSDIDYFLVTSGELPGERVAALEALHESIRRSELAWRTNYEGSYIPAQAIRRHDPAQSWHLVVRVDGTFGMEHHGVWHGRVEAAGGLVGATEPWCAVVTPDRRCPGVATRSGTGSSGGGPGLHPVRDRTVPR